MSITLVKRRLGSVYTNEWKGKTSIMATNTRRTTWTFSSVRFVIGSPHLLEICFLQHLFRRPLARICNISLIRRANLNYAASTRARSHDFSTFSLAEHTMTQAKLFFFKAELLLDVREHSLSVPPLTFRHSTTGREPWLRRSHPEWSKHRQASNLTFGGMGRSKEVLPSSSSPAIHVRARMSERYQSTVEGVH